MPQIALAPAYCGPSRNYHCRPSRRFAPASTPRFSFDPFLALVDETLGQIHRQAQRQAELEKQQTIFNARFDVRENTESYQVEGEVPGFEQENIEIEFTDENTLKISGSMERKAEPQTQSEIKKMEVESSASRTPHSTQTTAEDQSDGKSETSSMKSYQATVEDDFEDLGAESETMSSVSSTSNGKEKATEEPELPQTTVTQQSQAKVAAPQQQPTTNHHLVSERSYGSFTRTFNFPARVDVVNVRASLKNGLLSINVPKAAAFKTRRIAIQ